MDEDSLPFNDLLPDKVEVEVKTIAAYKREGQFTSLAVELLKETAIMTSLLAGTYPLDQHNTPRPWTRNEAVLAGLMVRLAKLQSGFLDQVCQNRREIADLILRPLIETIVNVDYLLTQDKDELIEEYIIYSLRTEKRFLLEIEENIKQRGSELPIETRMKQSIIGVFEKSSISPDDVDEKIKRQWGGNFREKAKAVGMEEGYLSIFGLPSHAVHGNWQDLITHHLEYEEGSFTPKTEWTHFRPQTGFGVAMFSVHANLLYARKLISQSHEFDAIQDVLVDLMVRVQTADELHDQFLQNKSEHL